MPNTDRLNKKNFNDTEANHHDNVDTPAFVEMRKSQPNNNNKNENNDKKTVVIMMGENVSDSSPPPAAAAAGGERKCSSSHSSQFHNTRDEFALCDFDTWPCAGARSSFRVFVAEFWGTFVLILFGVGVVATTMIRPDSGGFLSIAFGWGMAVTMGVFVSLGISGAHLNPCVTVANAICGDFPWKRVPGYILAQMLGAFLGAASAFGIFQNQLEKENGRDGFGKEHGFAGIFSTYPMPGNSLGSCVLAEFMCSFCLLFGVNAIFDAANARAKGFEPVAVGALVFVIGIAIGSPTGYAMNPARDFAPRLFSALLFGPEVFTRNDYYFWVPLLIPLLGGTAGMFLYKYFLQQTN